MVVVRVWHSFYPYPFLHDGRRIIMFLQAWAGRHLLLREQLSHNRLTHDGGWSLCTSALGTIVDV